ncbi:MAG: hypothetical protein JWP52_3960 [Rhizobacter sp.]|nr:hypothetical protein [Rhizobacter sp.]
MTTQPFNDANANGNTNTNDGSHDFDFWMGHWRIHNKRLLRRLAGCTEWESFEATGHTRPLPAGIGNLDDFTPVGWQPGYVGMSLRLFSPQTRNWSIYWLDNRSAGLDTKGELLPPVIGRFTDGVGVFIGRETFEGRPVVVRFIWSDITATSARWEQAFSADGGQTWEVNWVMEMSRLEA